MSRTWKWAASGIAARGPGACRGVGSGRDVGRAADEVARHDREHQCGRRRIVQARRRRPDAEQRELAHEVLEGLRLRDRTGRRHRRACRRVRRERLASGHEDGIHRRGAELSEHREDHLHLRPQRPDQVDLRPAQPDRAEGQRHRRLRRCRAPRSFRPSRKRPRPASPSSSTTAPMSAASPARIF